MLFHCLFNSTDIFNIKNNVVCCSRSIKTKKIVSSSQINVVVKEISF